MSTLPNTISVIVESEAGGGSIDITALTKLKHADLWRAAKNLATKRYGGQSALARKLGVTPSEIGEWINMKACPPKHPTRAWPEERLHKLECDLAELTGKTLEELFPDSLRDNAEFLSASKVHEREFSVEQYALANYAEATRQRLIASSSPRLGVDKEDLREAIAEAMGALSYREREIVKLRFGVNDQPPMTYAEIAAVFRLSVERIRQIEKRAIGKLQRPSVAERLSAVVE